MKILFIITGLRYGGAEKLLYLTCKYLTSAYGADIRVIYFDPYAPMQPFFIELGIKTELVPRNLALLPRLFKRLREGHYDIVHTHLIHADIYGRLAALLMGKRQNYTIFTTVHDVDWFRWQRGWYFALVRTIDTWLSQSKRCRVIAISKAVKEMLIERQNYEGEKITILYNAIEIDANPSPHLPTQTIKCLYLGRLVKKKNIPCLLQAIARLKSHDLMLTIVGEGEEEKFLQELVVQLDLQDKVRFFPATWEVESYYRESDLFILPSTYEGLGIVILEAFSHALTVIGSDVHGISELLADDRGILFPNNDVQALADGIEELIRNPQRRIYYGRRGYAYVKSNHDIRDYARMLYQLYGGSEK